MAAVGSRLLSHNNFWPNIKPQKEVKLEIGPGRAALALQVGMENFALQLAGNFSDGLQARNAPMSWNYTQSCPLSTICSWLGMDPISHRRMHKFWTTKISATIKMLNLS